MSSVPQPQMAFLQEAITAALAGDKAKARDLLEEIARTHPNNELIWLWLASVAATSQELLRCWRQVLKLNPQQEQARTGLQRLLWQEGVAAAKEGRKDEARVLFLELTALAAEHEMAWLWLASLAQDMEEAKRYTRRVLHLNPHNERARAWLERLQAQAIPPSLPPSAPVTATPPPSSESPATENWRCPFCETEAQAEPTRCVRCQAIVSLANLEELWQGKERALPLVQEAVVQLEDEMQAAGEQADPALLFKLGVGCLNLNRLGEGADYLRQAAALNRQDTRLQEQVRRLLQRIAAPPPVAVNALTTPVGSLPPLPTEAVSTGSYTILVVDDSPTIRKLVSLTLEKYGHHVVCAQNGLDALNTLKEAIPDLILSDITMPQMDGYQLCKMIRSNAVTKTVPVIMLSGKDGIFDKLRGRLVGATAYITKPFEIDSLLQLIDLHCQQAQRI